MIKMKGKTVTGYQVDLKTYYRCKKCNLIQLGNEKNKCRKCGGELEPVFL